MGLFDKKKNGNAGNTEYAEGVADYIGDQVDATAMASAMAGRSMAPENIIDFNNQIIKPAIKDVVLEHMFDDLTQDMNLSNLDFNDMFLVRQNMDLAGHFIQMSEIQRDNKQEAYANASIRCAELFIRDAHIVLNTARSKNGFERIQLTTVNIRQSKSLDNNRQKPGWKLF
jgi:hypothetical protein